MIAKFQLFAQKIWKSEIYQVVNTNYMKNINETYSTVIAIQAILHASF